MILLLPLSQLNDLLRPQSAFVENLNGHHLFNKMYKDDVEGLKLNKMPGVDEMLVL